MTCEQDGTSRLEPIEGVLAILDHGSVTGTNKYGLLLALLDLAPGCSTDGVIELTTLADRLIEIHWDHARPFHDTVLRQVNSSNRANTQVMLQVVEIRSTLPARMSGLPLERARRDIKPNVWAAALAAIEPDLWRNPIARLQRLPGDPAPFLFERHSRPRRIQFLPGVSQALTRFAGVLRPLIEFRFAQFVASANRQTLGPTVEEDLQEHLFGVSRHMPPPPMRRELGDLQHHKCLYTGDSIGRETVAARLSIDHVIPWSRQRLSTIENFVATTTTTNTSKTNLLLGPNMIERWRIHIDNHADALATIAHEHAWPTDPERTLKIMTFIYAALDPATGVWDGSRDGVLPVTDAGKDRIAALLS